MVSRPRAAPGLPDTGRRRSSGAATVVYDRRAGCAARRANPRGVCPRFAFEGILNGRDSVGFREIA
ncbi:hypothetical protein GQ57_14790 [Burkholderia sp. MSh2]|nr:hypothetical protein GQ57_14790 [Burkholderia sp. MSh2]KFG95991.1 hypothetical protein GQ56_0117680 [Burkholderia paludis]